MASMTRRKSTCRDRPCPCCGGINPLMISHCLSVVSVGYVFLFIPLSYEKPPGTAPSHPAHAVFPRNNYQTDSKNAGHRDALRIQGSPSQGGRRPVHSPLPLE